MTRIARLAGPRRTRTLLRLGAVVAATSATLSGVVVTSQSASARTLKQQIAAAHQQLRDLDNQAETASEQYDAARIKLADAQAAATKANASLSSARHNLASLHSTVTSFVVAAYRGGATNSLLDLISDGSAGRYVSQISSMQAVSTSEARTLTQVSAAQRIEEQAQANASAALAKQQAATTAMQSSRDRILAAAAKEKKILGDLEAREAAIIKAAKARAARLAAEREQARLREAQAATTRAANALGGPVGGAVAPVVSGSGGAQVAVEWAYREIGKPYQWAAAGPNSFDCSGLTQYVWGKAGVYLGHYTGDQWNEGTHVTRDQLEPGDLVFFAYNTSDPGSIHHVGIYVGGGMMIDAPYTGANVRKESAFRSDYIGAVRP
ncbi:MAG TPA: NlpC/P60 family protein [Mycobacteriales bacterium]|nr:NlpC/P60 family protein [Mycobacteriales bacterium]HWC34216.1 NlpC/P60 family protein [Mycobacteriales bacterium]